METATGMYRNNTDVKITYFHSVFLEFRECHSNKRDTPVRQLCHG